jgi:4-hydroxy-tetrahydrodipicolinate synthase
VAGRFGSVLTAMITPFHADGSLDIDGAVALAKWLVDHGNDGLVLAGTTGEAPVLTDAERLELIETVTSAVTVPVIAGTGTNDTPHSIHMTASATKMGIAGVLAVCPYYNRPSQAGITAHMRAVADAAAGLPVVVYDIPVRSGRKINTATVLDLARTVPNILALKDAAGNPAETARVIADAPTGFEVYSGDDGMTLPLLAVGAVGVIGVATHWSGVEHSEMMKCWFKGDTNGAREINAKLLDSYTFETGDDAPNPLPTKAMMRVMGLPAGQARLPMGTAPDWLEPRAQEVLAALRA